ncbi:hypothetical protein SMSP2_02468 [Limihaloglobus sulfuriphilus]|uniref:Lipoprotein n=1 Tax=Limihaloglobus sulfuriphilus TaxID=1851148 RepID=A0A1Q2MHT4_9BACT|nr:hypothetical protein [Limihaloglobus sulfuriphilus]AQQ72088.1 hypothetical protein SMSP2_02468 [Limihaloglobus sulfuriphilus]
MKAILIASLLIVITGCETFRPAPDEVQKQNAWLHQQTCSLAAKTARQQGGSPQLCGLTDLSHTQSQAWTAWTGMPDSPRTFTDADDILSDENYTLAEQAAQSAAKRITPDEYVLEFLDMAALIAAVVGGAAGLKISAAIKTARDKAAAVREIITGNEIFKAANPQAADAFKRAQAIQSPQTRTIVTQLKTKTASPT